MPKIVYVTDLHGDTDVFEKILAQAPKQKVEAIVFGGDLNSHMTLMAVNGIEIQRSFLEDYFIPLIEGFKDENDIEVFAMMGNDDHSVNMDVLESAHKKGIIKLMHNKIHKLGNYNLIGYTFINPSDYLIFPINDWVKEEKEIKRDLEKLTKKMDSKSIFTTHTPPLNTNLDIFYGGHHVGSSAVREIIKKKQPKLVLSGHIHESCILSGEMGDKIGKTFCLNPGNARPLVIDLDTLKMKLLK